jgi:hypothetical protein
MTSKFAAAATSASAACRGVSKVLMFGAAALSPVTIKQRHNVAKNETTVFMVVLLISGVPRRRHRVNVRRRHRQTHRSDATLLPTNACSTSRGYYWHVPSIH